MALNDCEIQIITKLDQGIREAQRFLDKAHLAREVFRTGSEDSYRSTHFAAAKRASMDLSKALAKLRNWRKEMHGQRQRF